LSRIACLFFATTSTSHCSISISLHCASAIIYTFVACYTFNCTSMNNFFSCATTLSSLASICIIYTSTKWYSSASSFFDSSMHTGSIDVVLGPICSLTCQHCLLLRKNSTVNVLVVSMSWISFMQTVSSHYTPSLLHIPKMMMNATTTL
jgi:hypothetical protein